MSDRKNIHFFSMEMFFLTVVQTDMLITTLQQNMTCNGANNVEMFSNFGVFHSTAHYFGPRVVMVSQGL